MKLEGLDPQLLGPTSKSNQNAIKLVLSLLTRKVEGQGKTVEHTHRMTFKVNRYVAFSYRGDGCKKRIQDMDRRSSDKKQVLREADSLPRKD